MKCCSSPLSHLSDTSGHFHRDGRTKKEREGHRRPCVRTCPHTLAVSFAVPGVAKRPVRLSRRHFLPTRVTRRASLPPRSAGPGSHPSPEVRGDPSTLEPQSAVKVTAQRPYCCPSRGEKNPSGPVLADGSRATRPSGPRSDAWLTRRPFTVNPPSLRAQRQAFSSGRLYKQKYFWV